MRVSVRRFKELIDSPSSGRAVPALRGALWPEGCSCVDRRVEISAARAPNGAKAWQKNPIEWFGNTAGGFARTRGSTKVETPCKNRRSVRMQRIVSASLIRKEGRSSRYATARLSKARKYIRLGRSPTALMSLKTSRISLGIRRCWGQKPWSRIGKDDRVRTARVAGPSSTFFPSLVWAFPRPQHSVTAFRIIQ